MGIYLLEIQPLNETKPKPIRHFTKPIRHFRNDKETGPSRLSYWTKISGTVIGDMEETFGQ